MGGVCSGPCRKSPTSTPPKLLHHTVVIVWDGVRCGGFVTRSRHGTPLLPSPIWIDQSRWPKWSPLRPLYTSSCEALPLKLPQSGRTGSSIRPVKGIWSQLDPLPPGGTFAPFGGSGYEVTPTPSLCGERLFVLFTALLYARFRVRGTRTVPSLGEYLGEYSTLPYEAPTYSPPATD